MGEIEARKREPKDDLLTAITQATIQGSDITDELRWGMAQLLMIAGHETTVNALANLVHHLINTAGGPGRGGDQMPRGTFKAITESLRLDSPVFGFAHTVVSGTRLNEAQLLEDDRVLVCFGPRTGNPKVQRS